MIIGSVKPEGAATKEPIKPVMKEGMDTFHIIAGDIRSDSLPAATNPHNTHNEHDCNRLHHCNLQWE